AVAADSLERVSAVPPFAQRETRHARESEGGGLDVRIQHCLPNANLLGVAAFQATLVRIRRIIGWRHIRRGVCWRQIDDHLAEHSCNRGGAQPRKFTVWRWSGAPCCCHSR